MAESRPKIGTITLKLKRTERINIFGAEEWADTTNGKPGRFRLRINGKWYSPTGEKYYFLTSNGLQHFLNKKLKEVADAQLTETPSFEQLRLKKGHSVRFTTLYNGWPQTQRTRLKADPFQDDAGDWRVLLAGISYSAYLVDVTPD